MDQVRYVDPKAAIVLLALGLILGHDSNESHNRVGELLVAAGIIGIVVG